MVLETDADLADPTVAELVAAIEPEWHVQRIRRYESGTDFVARVSLAGRHAPRRVVLKATTAGLVEPACARTEPLMLRALADEPLIPVPRLYGAVQDHPDFPAPFYLVEWKHGQLIEDDDRIPESRRRSIMRQAGRILAQLHEQFEFDRFGSLEATDDHIQVLDTDESPAYDEFGAWLWNSANDALAALESGGGYFPDMATVEGRFTDLVDPARTVLEQQTGQLAVPESPTVCHTDFRFGNLLVDPLAGRITAVLDWANLLAGDPLYDLAFAESMLLAPERDGPQLTGTLRNDIRTSYVVHRPGFTIDESAQERVSLYQFVWRLHAMACLPLWYQHISAEARDKREGEHRAAVKRYLDRHSMVSS